MKGSYSVIKFVPDSVRFEPVNVGLVVQAGDHLLTRMAEDVDPRIRLADPYADLQSLREFLNGFDAAEYDQVAGPTRTLEWLHEHGLPNIFFSAPRSFDVEAEQLELMTESLHDRLVRRSFVRPPEMLRVPGISAARTALRDALTAVGVLNKRVEPQVLVIGASGIERRIDFRYVTDEHESLIQTATTSLHEVLRGKEHGYGAFLALLDATAKPSATKNETAAPPRHGILAVDADPRENNISDELKRMSKTTGFAFVAGQRGFFTLAEQIRRQALPIGETVPTSAESHPSLWPRSSER